MDELQMIPRKPTTRSDHAPTRAATAGPEKKKKETATGRRKSAPSTTHAQRCQPRGSWKLSYRIPDTASSSESNVCLRTPE
ncbi:hypothetical protein MTO96_014178 [Rhipicephalus appendiculatus]